MKISTRGRYALRMMTFLADNLNRGYIPLNEIATKQSSMEKNGSGLMLGEILGRTMRNLVWIKTSWLFKFGRNSAKLITGTIMMIWMKGW